MGGDFHIKMLEVLIYPVIFLPFPSYNTTCSYLAMDLPIVAVVDIGSHPVAKNFC